VATRVIRERWPLVIRERWPAGACPAYNKHVECKNTTKLVIVVVALCNAAIMAIFACTVHTWEGGTPRKLWYGCAARFPKPLPYS